MFYVTILLKFRHKKLIVWKIVDCSLLLRKAKGKEQKLYFCAVYNLAKASYFAPRHVLKKTGDFMPNKSMNLIYTQL